MSQDLFNFHFGGQKEGEQVLMIIHRHWFNILQHMFAVFVMVLLLVGSFATLPALFPLLLKGELNSLLIFAENIFAMLIWILFFILWIDYYFDVWIVTNMRVVNIEQKGLFSREVSELNFDKIQDVSTEVNGMIPTFLNYGDVQIQTAGEEEKFMFRNVPDPYNVKDILMRLQKNQKKDETEQLRNIIHKDAI